MGESIHISRVFLNALPSLFYKRVFHLLDQLASKPEVFSCSSSEFWYYRSSFFCGFWGSEFRLSNSQTKELTAYILSQVFSRQHCHFNLYTTWFLNVFISFHIPDKVGACLAPLVITLDGFCSCMECSRAAVMEWTAHQENVALVKTRRLTVLRWTFCIHSALKSLRLKKPILCTQSLNKTPKLRHTP